jgi:hypothetical protein
MNIAELRLKAESGSTVAQGLLGIGYLHGYDCEVNYAEALKYLTSAVEKGATRPTANLAYMYANGLGVSRDMGRAIDLYERVGGVEFDAAIALGRIYSIGLGIPIDESRAYKWYSVAVGFEGRVVDCDEELREARTFLNSRSSG